MSKIKDVLRDKESVLAFDIDGVLAQMEWGEYNHFELFDDEWFESCEAGINGYTEEMVIKKMQQFLSTRDMSRIYVISKIGHPNEADFKKEFCKKFYDILEENVHLVWDEKEKLGILNQIAQKYPNVEHHKIAMVEDTVGTLNDIMTNSDFTTIHVSSFLDI